MAIAAAAALAILCYVSPYSAPIPVSAVDCGDSRAQAMVEARAMPIRFALGGGPGTPAPSMRESTPMYGLMGRMIAQPGQREALIAILLEGTEAMPGCLSYVVARDAKDGNAIWVTEVWESKEAHAASLKLPAVQAAIAKGRPLIAGFDSYTETSPAGGVGLTR